MKILLFGKNGQVGWELQRSLAPLASSGQLIALGSDSQTMCGNLAEPEGIQQTVQRVRPDIIINAAAYTAVDKAEKESPLAQTINALAPAVLAEEARRLNAWLIHYSTDYVFDGTGDQPRIETDAANPLNVYGKTKLAGEKKILESGCLHVILRTSWVYATYGNNFVKTILRLAQERDQLQIVDDQVGAPTGAELLADVTAHIVQLLRNQRDNPAVNGLYHLTAKGYTSWYGFARFILTQAARANVSLKTTPGNLHPIASADYPTPAKRPHNSRLDSAKLQKTFNLCLPEWQGGVSRTLTEVLGSYPKTV
ncbi:dTDP-4-dehydrorhamnose reductase [Nitrosomonas sp.]|uniref:dTDP-4-dehydrorhamnose reductase n=1 Tax=Nitrosomonas sp. TaxID=42353 RepID=UPI0020836087|nr:dTDP-4-dehydrorhamnose reductase [Nitrosomonas sp.]GJL74266.1 MAG: dTDP-4-dehydrorhamnose reductase [Nitrosomonas sp.]